MIRSMPLGKQGRSSLTLKKDLEKSLVDITIPIRRLHRLLTVWDPL